MIKRFLSPLLRFFALSVLVLLCLGLIAPLFMGGTSAGTSGPQIWLQDSQALTVNYAGPAGATMSVAPSQPVAMVQGDFDQDGVNDLAVGYSSGFIAIHRGNLDAFAPQSDASFQAIARSEFPSPFLPQAQTFNVPISPDFIVAGDFTGNGTTDLALASQGGSTVYIFAGDGKGHFTAGQTIPLPAGVTSLAAGTLNKFGGASSLIIGASSRQQTFLAVYSLGSQGMAPVGAFPLTAPVTSINFGRFGEGDDAAFLSGGQVYILRSSVMQLSKVSLPVSARAFALGNFIYDRNGNSEIALLGVDGSVVIAARNEFDPRPYSLDEFRAIRQARLNNQVPAVMPHASFPANGWKIVESFPAVGSVSSNQPPVFFRTRISVNSADDIMWLSAASGQMVVISHADLVPGSSTFVPGQISLKPYAGSPLTAISTRVNADPRPGILALHQGDMAIHAAMPIPDPTFFVNTTGDPTPTTPIAQACKNSSFTDLSSSCSLREAMLKANGDTIMVPAGTITLTRPKVTNDCTGNNGALSAERTLTIIGSVDGSGNPTSIVQAGTTAYNAGTANGVDMVMNVNEDLATANCPITNASASISNLVLQNGHNRGTHSNDGDGGCMEFDTGTGGTATLTLTNVILQNCNTTAGNGGGLASFNFETPTGTNGATISNSIVQGNSATDTTNASTIGVAGGIWVTDASRLTMTNSQVKNNLATQATATANGEGGGLFIFSKGTTGEIQTTLIHSSTISGNQSAGQGGGIWDSAPVVIDQGTTISNNKNGQNGGGVQDGGGFFIDLVGCPAACQSATLSHLIITGNTSTGRGGGIATGSGSAAGPLIMQFSRLAGNTAGSTGSNLENIGNSIVTATNNWWGTNAASTTIHTGTGGTTTFDPFIVLTHTSNPVKIRINQSSALTGDISSDNHGTAIGLANLTQIIGLPITFDSPVLGTIPQAQPEVVNASAQAAATFNAGGVSGLGSANATIDQAVVPVNSNLVATATEAGTTATITTVGKHNFSAGNQVTIAGVGVSGYNGTFIITGVSGSPTTQFTYTANAAGLAASSGGSASIGLVVLQPPSITKSFSPKTIATAPGANSTSTVTFSITNANVVAINASFTDALPANVGTVPGNLVVATTPSVTNNCGGTVTATAGSGTISFTNATLPVGTCNVTVNVQSATDNNYTNSVTILSTDAGNGNTSSDTLDVINPPHMAKAFGAATIPLNGTTSLTLTVSSTNVNQTLNSISFTDTLPAGLVVATPSGLTTTCSGTATAAAGSSSANLTGASLAPGSSCTVSLNVVGTTAGVKNNSVTASDTTAGSGNTANASVTVVSPPVIIKAFGAASIPLNGSTGLTFTIQNGNTTLGLTGVAFSDTLPAGLIVSTPNGLTGSCGAGTITATAGSGTISLSGGTIAASGSCAFTVNVTGISAGTQTNTTGNVTSTEGGTGGTATASVNVEAPPSIAKVFTPSTIALNATTSLTFTITNPAANVNPLTGVAFTDTLPTGLTVGNASATICGGTVTTTAPTGISLTGATIAANSQCQFSVTVTGAASGQYTNTTAAVSSTNGGTGNTATANLTVAAPPSITKAFTLATIPLNGTTTLTFNITNPNTGTVLTGVAFTDSLPAGLVVAGIPNLTNNCGGTATAVGGASSVSLSAGTLASSASCTVSVSVQGNTAGVKNNSVQVTSTEGGTGNTSNASITVVAPPLIIKAFGAASIPLNGTTSLQFNIQNNNTTASLSGIGFSDTLPAGLVIATPNGLTGSCGGGTITAAAGAGVVSLSGATLGASTSCTFSINVKGTAAGLQNNTTGNVTSTEGGTGGTASASVAVEAPPSIAKVFTPSTISLNATTSLTFTITNPAGNVNALTGVAFTDTLPTGLTVGNASATICGGTVTTTAPTGISLTGATIAAAGQCQFSVTVTGAASGQYTNTTGAVSSTNGGTGNTATANLTVASPPSIIKAFTLAQIPLNGTTTLTFTLTNPNTGLGLTGLAFTDNLPAGLVVAGTPNLTNNCGGTATAVAGATSVSLSAGTLASSANCTVSVSVQGNTAGVKNNSVQVTSTEGGTGNTSNASITVVAPPVIIKAFGAASIPLNGTTSLQFNIQNNNTTASLSGIGFSDTLPAGLVIATPNGLTGSCGGGTITATAGAGVVSLSGATLGASTSCVFTINVKGTAAGLQNNTTGNVTSNEGGTGGTASASVVVEAPPSIAKVFNPNPIALNATTSLTFTITNPGANVNPLTGVAFSDTLPSGLTVANATSAVCGGTLTTTAPTGISLSGATVAVAGQCQFSVSVVGAASGQYTNTTGPVSSTNGGTGNTASANLTVASPPTITKAFNPTTIPLDGTTTLTFNINNPNSGVGLTGIAFTDNFPAGVVVANPSNLSSTCGGTVTATPAAGSTSLSGGAVAASGSCTISLTVQGTSAGTKLNTTGAISSTEGGTGTTSNTASLTVAQATTSTAVSSSANPSVFGQSVTFTATVTDTSGGSIAQPTGTVQFLVDGAPLGGPVTLAGASSNSSTATSQATATLSVNGSPHTVTASYINADGNFTNSAGSLAGGQTVTPASTSTVAVSSSNPSTFGQPVTFTATVTDTSAGSTAQPTGSVQFVVDGVNFGTPVALVGASSNSSAAISGSTASLSIAGSPHAVTANYLNADGNFNPSSGIVLGGQVVTQANTTTTVISSAGTITIGDAVTFTATVTANPPGSGTPTGIVTFFDGSSPIGNGKLSGGQTTFPTALLGVGSHSITAIYNGDANFTASPLSSPITETVNLRGTTTGVSLNPTTVGAGGASTITVTVTDGGASTPPGTPDVFTATGAPQTGRTGFTATLFTDGAVVITGGTDANGNVLKSAEFYFGGTFNATPGSLNTARTGAVAVLLPNGKVLIAGGSSDNTPNGALNSAELLDLNSGTFTPSSNTMTAARFGTTATMLNNGKVLLAGGINSGGVVNSAELYDPATDTFTATGNLNAARTGASATLLGTGKVLIAGGSSDGTSNGALSSAEVFDPAGNAGAGTFTTVAGANPALATGRFQPEAALLLSGKVLIAGGQSSGAALTSADLYDPVADSFTASAHAMNEGRSNGSALALPNGMVLLAGGTTSETVELYDPEGDKFNLTGSLLQFDSGLVSTLLNNGQVLVIGLNSTPASDAELYSPSFNPLGTVGFGSSEPTDAFGPACVLTPTTSTASTCTSTVTTQQVATSPHTITGTYPADLVHSSSSNSASLTVIPTAPPSITKAFGATNVAQNGTVGVSFTITNPNPAATLTGISFTDSLPAGLVVATPNNLNNSCGGTFTAAPGSSSISLTGGTIAPPGPPPQIRRTPSGRLVTPSLPIASGQCVITLDLLVTGTGTLNNTTGAISANESGPGNPSNTASLNVVLPPTANKAFGAASIPLNGNTTLTFNLANPNTAIPLNSVTLTDNLPSGLVVANPNGLTGSCVALSLITANAGSNSISLSGLSLAPAGSCSFVVNVTGILGGVQNNTTAPVAASFDDGSGTFRVVTGGTASASVTVLAPDLTIAKSHVGNFNRGDAADNYQITVTNNGGAPTLGTVTVTDTLPAGLTATAISGTGWTCPTLTSCNRSDALAIGASYPAITLTVSVSATAPASVVNSVTVSGGGETNPANDTATDPTTIQQPDLTIAKSHSGNFTQGDVGDKYQITVSNAGVGPTVGTVTVTEAPPSFLIPTAISGTGWTCATLTTCTRSDVLGSGASYPPITFTVSVAVNAPTTLTNSVSVAGGGESNTANDTATDATNINQLPGPPLTIGLLVPSTQTIKNGNSAQFVFDVVSHSATLGNIGFACSGLPKGAACSFTPQTESLGDAQVVMTVTTTADTESRLKMPLGGRSGPMYAALLFPVLGLVSLAAAGSRGKKNRMRLVMFLGSMVVLMALFGCGGTPHNGTPLGQFPITVTATSAANPTVTATTQVVVTVQ